MPVNPCSRGPVVDVESLKFNPQASTLIIAVLWLRNIGDFLNCHCVAFSCPSVLCDGMILVKCYIKNAINAECTQLARNVQKKKILELSNNYEEKILAQNKGRGFTQFVNPL